MKTTYNKQNSVVSGAWCTLSQCLLVENTDKIKMLLKLSIYNVVNYILKLSFMIMNHFITDWNFDLSLKLLYDPEAWFMCQDPVIGKQESSCSGTIPMILFSWQNSGCYGYSFFAIFVIYTNYN